MTEVFKNLIFIIALLLPISSVNAVLLPFHDRAEWLAAVGSDDADLFENFDSIEKDMVYFAAPAQVGFLTFSATGNASDNRWRIDDLDPGDPNNNAAFSDIASVNDSPFAISASFIETANKRHDTLITLDPMRAIGFEYSNSQFSGSAIGSISTNLGGNPIETQQASSTTGVFFLGLLATEGETIEELRLTSNDRFAIGMDNFEAFVASGTLNPVPLPAAFWLFASALAGLAGFSRRKTAAASV